MRTIGTIAVIVLATLGWSPAVVVAQDTPSSSPLSVTAGGRLWVTSGGSSRSSSAPGFERLSELRWRGVDAIVPEVSVDLVWQRLVALASVGGGVINDGVLIDEDFSSDGTRFARTRSAVDDSHLWYVNADIGARVFDWATPQAVGRGYVDVLLGFQYWRERYVAFGATGFPGVVGSDIRAIENEYEWRSLRVGARAQVPVYGGLSVSLRGYVVPWSSLVIEDVHHLRGDLRRDPSFRDEADGGIGGQIDAAARYAVTDRLSVELGFQYWLLTSAEGHQTAFTTAGAVRQTLRDARTERYGPFVGVRWRF